MSFIPYQVDYAVKNTAKTLGFSKKKVTFKFGFANPTAIENGATGPTCRGSEHDVTFLWSLKTGKRQLFLDGKEVHFSESGQNGWTTDRTWQYAFALRLTTTGSRHPLKVHFISQPVNPNIPDSRPFDVRIGGVSYFQFNQIFQLGTSGMAVRGAPREDVGPTENNEMLSPEERRMIAQAKLESLKDIDRQQHTQRGQAPAVASSTTTSMTREEGSLIDFSEPTQPQAMVQGAAAARVPPYQQFTSDITLDTAFDDRQQQPAYGMPPSSNPYGSYSNNPYAPAPQYSQPPAPAPMYAQYAQQPAPAPMYAQQPAPGALTTYQPPAGQPTPSPYAFSQPAPYGAPYGAPPQQSSYGAPQQTPYGHQPPPMVPMVSPSAQSFASFGSAPSFAQPPRQQPAATGYYNQQQAPQQQGYS
jgi:hypothetical protein